jgi:hypothetical protein
LEAEESRVKALTHLVFDEGPFSLFLLFSLSLSLSLSLLPSLPLLTP